MNDKIAEIKLWHAQLANQCLYWMGEDNAETLANNLQDPIKKEILESNEWTTKEIAYKFNGHGFRGNEIRQDVPNFCVFGDSITFGVGLGYDDLYSFHIEKATGLYCHNFGVPAGSDSTSFRLAYTWIENLKPKFVLWQKTFDHRFEWISPEKAVVYGVNPTKAADPLIKDTLFFKQWLAVDANRILLSIKNEMAMKWLCQEYDIPLIITTIEEFFPEKNDDLARDLLHPGPRKHRDMAEKLLKEIHKVL